MNEGRWKQRCGDLDHSGHDWYGVLDRTLQSYPELVAEFESRQEYECYLSWKVQSALDVYNASIERHEPEQSAREIAMEELLSMAISKDAEDNPDPPPEILEAARADMAAGVFAYLNFLYGNTGRQKRS
jgi:hypothetical protein